MSPQEALLAAAAHPEDPGNFVIDHKTREAWLAARMHGIGGSEAAAVFDQSPYKSAYALWAEKTGLVPPEELEGEWLEWGQLLEPAIATKYERVTGRRLWTASPYAIAHHPRVACMLDTPDRWVIGEPGILQIKNAAWFKDEEWAEGVPLHIMIQVQHELAVTGRQWADVAVLVGGCKFRTWPVERNEDFIGELELACEAFWRRVQNREPPEPRAHEATYRVLKALHPLDDGSTITLPPEAAQWWDQMQATRADRLALEKQAKALKAQEEDFDVKFRAAFGNATFGELGDGRILSLCYHTRASFVTAASSWRSLKEEKRKPAKAAPGKTKAKGSKR